MLAIEIRFLTGRYHATDWEHHVNEGVPEWPPSPFRILRALVAASYRLPEPIPREVLSDLVDALSAPPVFHVPPANAAHTRHYMPIEKRGTTKVLDTFVALGPAGVDAPAVVVAWPSVELPSEPQALLDRLLEHLGYLGRAESWIAARRITGIPGSWNVVPLGAGGSASHEVRLLALDTPEAYSIWISEAPPVRDTTNGERKRRQARSNPPPRDLLGVLHLPTSALYVDGWNRLPGTCWQRYGFENRPFVVRSRPRTSRPASQPTTARLLLTSRVLPRVTETLWVAERLRTALLSWSRDEDGRSSTVFLGKDKAGRPLEGHLHAYILPVDADADGRLDEVVIHARSGFDLPAQEALTRLRRLWGHGGHDLHVRLVSLGVPEDFGGVTNQPGRSDRLGTATVWESRTPWIATRHPKRRTGRLVDAPEDQISAALTDLGFPVPVGIARIDEFDTPVRPPWYRFRTERLAGGGRRATHRPLGFRLVFPDPVTGPIGLGYGAHLGLGAFAAIR